MAESATTLANVVDETNEEGIAVNHDMENVVAVTEQAAGSEEILASSEVMVTNCDQVTSNSKEIDNESKQLKDTAEKLGTYVKRFKVEREEETARGKEAIQLEEQERNGRGGKKE